MAQGFCLWMWGGVEEVWIELVLWYYWPREPTRGVMEVDGGGHHGFHAICGMAFLTGSKGKEHLGRTWGYEDILMCIWSPPNHDITLESSQ
jgi:hypothetical protein